MSVPLLEKARGSPPGPCSGLGVSSWAYSITCIGFCLPASNLGGIWACLFFRWGRCRMAPTLKFNLRAKKRIPGGKPPSAWCSSLSWSFCWHIFGTFEYKLAEIQARQAPWQEKVLSPREFIKLNFLTHFLNKLNFVTFCCHLGSISHQTLI